MKRLRKLSTKLQKEVIKWQRRNVYITVYLTGARKNQKTEHVTRMAEFERSGQMPNNSLALGKKICPSRILFPPP